MASEAQTIEKEGGTENKGFDKSKVDIKSVLDFVHSKDSVEAAFGSEENFNAIRMLIMSDKVFLDNAMRLYLPNNRVIMAIAGLEALFKEANYIEGIEWLMMLCGLLCSKRGIRAQMFVDAIIGERKWRDEQKQGGAGMMNKLQNFAFGQKPQ